MYLRKDVPKKNDYVIITIEEIGDFSVKVKLDEFERFYGVIPIDELSSKRITNVREVVKEGRKAIGVVLDVDPINRLSIISLKRVDKNKAKGKILEYKREIQAYNIIKIISEKENIDIKELEDEIVYKIIPQEKLYTAFLNLYLHGEEALSKYKIKKKYINLLLKYVKEYLNPQKYKIRYRLLIYSLDPDGIIKIKEFLKEIEKFGFKIKYLAAADYLLEYVSYNPKDIQSAKKNLEKFMEAAKSKNLIYEINEEK